MKKSINKKFLSAKEAFLQEQYIALPPFEHLLDSIHMLSQEPGVYLIKGEPGCGKSTLLRHFAISRSNVSYFSPGFCDDDLLKIFDKLKRDEQTFVIDEAELYDPRTLERLRISAKRDKLSLFLVTSQDFKPPSITFENAILKSLTFPSLDFTHTKEYIQKKLINHSLLPSLLLNNLDYRLIYRYTKGNLGAIDRFLYLYFDILYHYNGKKGKRKFLEMSAIELGYIDV